MSLPRLMVEVRDAQGVRESVDTLGEFLRANRECSESIDAVRESWHLRRSWGTLPGHGMQRPIGGGAAPLTFVRVFRPVARDTSHTLTVRCETPACANRGAVLNVISGIKDAAARESLAEQWREMAEDADVCPTCGETGEPDPFLPVDAGDVR